MTKPKDIQKAIAEFILINTPKKELNKMLKVARWHREYLAKKQVRGLPYDAAMAWEKILRLRVRERQKRKP